jgi:hypothetical protein
MDKRTEPGKWAWLPLMMPRAAKLIAEKRKLFGDAHVNECWKRGVLLCEPGWFFAREAGLAVGVPWEDLRTLAVPDLPLRDQVLVAVRDPGVNHGA